MKAGERFQDTEIIAWVELPRVAGCTIEGACLCRDRSGLLVVWWILRNEPGGMSHAHQGYYSAEPAKAVKELSNRIARYLGRE